MKLPISIVLLVSCLSAISSHPKNSDIIPKDYYKRQILQPIPGYIPVYIQTDAEPTIRREVKHSPNLHLDKPTESREHSIPRNTGTDFSINDDKNLGKISDESSVKEPKGSYIENSSIHPKLGYLKSKGKY